MRILKNLFTKPRKIIDSLFLGTAVLIIIPILILGLSLTWIFSSGYMKQTDRINTNTVDYVVELLGENISTIYNSAYILGNDENVLRHAFLKKGSYEYARNLDEISTALVRQQLQSDFIKEIYIFYRDSLDVAGINYGRLSAFEVLEDGYGVTTEELADFLVDNSMRFIKSKSQKSEFAYDILLAKCIDVKFNKTGNIYAIYILDGRAIGELIDMINLEDVGHSLLLDADENLLLGDEAVYEKYKKYFDNIMYEKERSSHVLIKEVEKDRLNLCFVIDNAYYTSMIRVIWVAIISIGIAIVVISMFISRFYIRRLYRPFGNIINMFKPEEEEYGLKSELEFLEEKYIEIQNMKLELESYKISEDNGLQEMFFHNFLKGFYMTDYKMYMQDMGIFFEKAFYTVLTVKIDNFKAIAQHIKLSHYRRFIKDKLVGILYGHNPRFYSDMFHFYDGEYIGLLVCHDEEFEDIKQECAFLQHELLSMLQITISVCVSDTVTEPEELVKEYKALTNAMQQMKFCKSATVLTMQDYKKIGKYVDFSKYKGTVIQYITERDYKKLDALIDKLLVESRVFYTEVIQLVTGFLTVMADMQEKSGNGSHSLFGAEIYPYDEIGQMRNVGEIAAYVKQLCHDVGNKLYAEETNKNEMYDKIMNYISANYMKDISLTVMAKDFGLSSSYFSRCFKEVIGKNYSEVLNSYRVEKAKELVDSEEEIKMFQVAELVGFASYKAFAEAFKKYVGMSPESYKKNRNTQNSLEM